MIKYENQCCDCAVPSYPCMGDACKYRNVPVYYCDSCSDYVEAEYEIDGHHYCKEHAEVYLNACFNKLSLIDKAEYLDMNLSYIDELGW